VLAHLDGLCHTYIDKAADPAKAVSLAVNAKMRRTGICGATETLLIDRGYGDPKAVLSALVDAGCELRGTPEVQALDSRVVPAAAEDWDTEYLDAVCSVALVGGVGEAMAHIAAHSSHHTDAVRRRRRVRAGGGDRHLDRADARPRAGRARRAHHLQVDRQGHGTDAALNRLYTKNTFDS
jgi:gamma-glutamyl phosphate reductase